MIAQILPSLNLPVNIKTDFFTYIIPQKLEGIIEIGQMVEISFRNKKILGIIIEIKKENPENINKLKEINKIIQSEVKITKTQIDVINFISDNYYVSKAKALKTVIAVMPKNKIKVLN